MSETNSTTELRQRLSEGAVEIQRVAQISGVSRSSIYNLMHRSGIPRRETVSRLTSALATIDDAVTLVPPGRKDLDRAPLAPITAELEHVRALSRGSARSRAEELASELHTSVTQVGDLAQLRDQVASVMSSTVLDVVSDETAASLARARVLLETGEYKVVLDITAATARRADRRRSYVAHWLRSEALRMLGRWSDAATAATKAARSPDAAVRAWAYWNRAKVFDKRGSYSKAALEFRRALRLSRIAQLSDWERHDIEAWCLWGLAWLEVRTGASSAAIDLFEQALRAAPRGDAGVHIWIAHGLAQMQATTGELAKARSGYAAGLELAEAIGNRHYTAWMFGGLGELALVQGAYAAAIAWFSRAADVYELAAGPDAPSRAIAIANRLTAQAAHGAISWRDAGTRITELRDATDVSYLIARCSMTLAAAEALRNCAQLNEARSEFEHAERQAQANRMPLIRAHAGLGLAAVELTDDRSREASPTAWRGIVRARGLYEGWQCRWGMARCDLLALSAGRPIDVAALRRLVGVDYPLEAAEIDLALIGQRTLAPFVFPGG